MATETPSGRRFTFTLHNWTQTDWECLPVLCASNDDIECLKVAQETGSEGESPHFQGCVVFVRSFVQTLSCQSVEDTNGTQQRGDTTPFQ